MTLEYVGGSGYFLNGMGADIDLYETTWGDPACRPNISETATVEFSADGFNWINGTPIDACHNGSFDISPLEYAKYVRITDKTNPDWRVSGDGVDAYDYDHGFCFRFLIVAFDLNIVEDDGCDSL
jgi:hypothetical protein